MRTSQELDLLKKRAVSLRRAGKSRREIKEILGPMSSTTLNEALKDEPPERAGPGYAESRRRAAAGVQRYWAAERPARDKARASVSAAAAAEIGMLTAREIIIAGAIAYWREGAKSKPWRTSELVRFINSDPALINFFLNFLERAGYRASAFVSAYTSTKAPMPKPPPDTGWRRWVLVQTSSPGSCSSATRHGRAAGPAITAACRCMSLAAPVCTARSAAGRTAS
jgi:hypothetical protein